MCAYIVHSWVGSARMVTACSALQEIDPYSKNLITEMIFERLNYETTMKGGVF